MELKSSKIKTLDEAATMLIEEKCETGPQGTQRKNEFIDVKTNTIGFLLFTSDMLCDRECDGSFTAENK
jgi:hypothetical protein